MRPPGQPHSVGYGKYPKPTAGNAELLARSARHAGDGFIATQSTVIVITHIKAPCAAFDENGGRPARTTDRSRGNRNRNPSPSPPCADNHTPRISAMGQRCVPVSRAPATYVTHSLTKDMMPTGRPAPCTRPRAAPIIPDVRENALCRTEDSLGAAPRYDTLTDDLLPGIATAFTAQP